MDAAEQDLLFMRRALVLAQMAEAEGEVPVGAVAVLDGQIIGEGYNQPIGLHDPTAHAEIQALRAASRAVGNYRLTEVDLYVTLEPCAMCAGAMIHARIRRLLYAASDPRSGAAGSVLSLLPGHAAFNHRIEVEHGLLADEAGSMLSDFFRRKRQSNHQPSD